MEYKRIGDCGMRLASRGEYRKAVNLFLKAVLKAPTKDAKMRYYFFIFYTTILIHELHGEASPKEMEILHDRFLDNAEEPSYFRITAAHCIGNCLMAMSSIVHHASCSSGGGADEEDSEKQQDVAAAIYRKGLQLAKTTSKDEREMLVDSGPSGGLLPASFFIGTAVASIQENLNDIVNPLRVLEVVEEDPMPPPSTKMSSSSSSSRRAPLKKARSSKDFVVRNDLILPSSSSTTTTTPVSSGSSSRSLGGGRADAKSYHRRETTRKQRRHSEQDRVETLQTNRFP